MVRKGGSRRKGGKKMAVPWCLWKLEFPRPAGARGSRKSGGSESAPSPRERHGAIIGRVAD